MFRRDASPKGAQPIPRARRLTAPSSAPIERLRLTVLRRLDGLLAGDYGGLFPGHGTERGEARPYVPGDDPRHIDWAVTARHHEPHVRDMISDHELDVWLLLDSSASLAFGTGLTTKHELAWSVAGAFALLASTGGNRVGAIRSRTVPGRDRPELIPARGGSRHVSTVLTALHTEPVDGDAGDLGRGIEMLARFTRRRGMAVVISDFLDSGTWEKSLRSLSHRHEVIAVEVVDPRELDIPDVGLLAVVDPESGRRRLIDTSDRHARQVYRDLAWIRRAEVSHALKRAGADHLVLRTDRDWVLDFFRFVTTRKSRLMSVGR